MNILALDTATPILSVALSAGGGRYYMEIDAGQKHSEILMDGINDLMKRAGLSPEDLGGVVCMEGPGSFTGLRIGFAAAKGLALALGIPMGAVPTLDCMAAPLSPWPGIILPAMDAKKHAFFTALYRGAERISGYMDIDVPSIAAKITEARGEGQNIPLLLTGPDGDILKEKLCPHIPEIPIYLDPGYRRGRARELLEITQKCLIIEKGGGFVFDGPRYLRKSDAELNGR
ncbi:MAG: tRNA (adenosine(37)-N6)-threonylcarbamoyltransferase complex dimerization subunit type 1 TsaB [Treponema sp.]|jgi:tRNA threonylcarbamoyladenosine biosynthesis protein TsaB|nr:tRNA (adenosine(37)-N6)-threonylcarbamoyltransferase complex dimerization subunit type 1 TsaB [Treponema sp.]